MVAIKTGNTIELDKLVTELSEAKLPSLEAPVHNYITSRPGSLIKYRVEGDPDIGGYDSTALPVRNRSGQQLGSKYPSFSNSVTDTGIEFEEKDANTTRIRINLASVDKVAGLKNTGAETVSADDLGNSLLIPRRPGYTTVAQAQKAEGALAA